MGEFKPEIQEESQSIGRRCQAEKYTKNEQHRGHDTIEAMGEKEEKELKKKKRHRVWEINVIW